MRSRSTRRARTWGLLLALGALLVAAPLTGPAAAAEAGDVDVAVDAITPTVLSPGEDLTVTVTLTNRGATPVTQPRVIVHLSTAVFISRSSLDVWREASDSAAAGRVAAELDLGAPLAPGASVEVTATVPAARVGLPRSTSSWGARGLAVDVVDVADPARVRLGITRTFVVWFPEQDVTQTAVSVLVPVTGPAPSADATDEVTELTARGGRLDSVLRATAQHPDVTWAVDPWLLTVAARGADAETPEGAKGVPSPTPSASSTPSAPSAAEVAGAWAARLLEASDGREVQALPWGDADVTALAHAGRLDLLSRAQDRASRSSDELGLATSDVLVLPGESEPDLVTAGVAQDSALVVGPGALLPPGLLTYTPTGVATVATAAGDVTAVVADTRLSGALLTGRVTDASTDARDEDTDGADEDADRRAEPTPATAAADLLAELAVVTRERPAEARHLLAVLPRDWDPVPAVASAQLTALERAPFVRLATVAELAAAPATGVDRGTLPDRVVQDGEVAPAALDAVATAVDARRGIATMVDDPSALLGDLEPELLAPTALAWRAEPARRTGLVAASQARTAELRAAVSVPQPGDVNLVSRSGELPLRVATTLDQDVHLRLHLEPSSSRLVAEDVDVTVPAAGEATVQVPVHGVQSADVTVRVVLTTRDGVVVDDSTVMTVRVRAEWEGIGTAVAGVLLALGVVIGLTRTIRKGRRSRRATAGPEPAPVPAPAPTPDDGSGG